MDITLAQPRPWYTRIGYLALALLVILVAVLLVLVAWWHLTLRGLDTATSVYEQVRRLGGLLGVPHQLHMTPVEYGESLIRALREGQEDARYLVSSYVKQRFSKRGLSDAEDQDLQERWKSLRLRMWRQVLTPRRRKRRPLRPAWVPSSSLRPPTSLE